MFWMNVDKVFKKCVIHREACPWVDWVRNECKPEFKGIGEVKRDGGWLHFASLEELENEWKKEWEPKGYAISRDGCFCHRFRQDNLHSPQHHFRLQSRNYIPHAQGFMSYGSIDKPINKD